MRSKRVDHAERRGVLFAMMLLLGFILVMGLLLGGLYLFHVNGDFYSAFRHRLDGGFYLSAVLILLFSSVLFTPFFYGISYYFLQENGRFSQLFFLFHRPLLLTKATAVSVIKKILSHLERLALLLAAAILEVGLFFSFLVVTGEDVFAVSQDPFLAAAEFMLRSPWLISLSVILWSGVLLGMLIIYLRYILCKYMLLLYPDVGVLQAIRVGRRAIKGHLWRTMLFYLGYGAYCVLLILSFGLYRPARHQLFSAYAAELTRAGWRDYCRRRSRR